MTHIRIILKHLCLSGMVGIIQSKITCLSGMVGIIQSKIYDFEDILATLVMFYVVNFSQFCC